MNLKDINEYYEEGFDCDTQVDWDNDELNIKIRKQLEELEL